MYVCMYVLVLVVRNQLVSFVSPILNLIWVLLASSHKVCLQVDML